MRRFLLLLVVLGLACALAAPAAGARQARKVTEAYEPNPRSGTIHGHTNGELWVFVGPSTDIATKGSESVAQITVTDDSGQAVAAAAWQKDDEPTVFCGTSGSIPIQGGKPLFVQAIVDASPGAGVCDTPAPPTSGTITAKLR